MVTLKQAINSLNEYENVLVIGIEKMTSNFVFGQIETMMMASDRYLEQLNGLNGSY